jgi:hypothetical protein
MLKSAGGHWRRNCGAPRRLCTRCFPHNALAQIQGGPLGITTATERNGSASILRRLGGRPLEWDGAAQPAIAARVEWTGAGESLPLARLTVPQLRATIREVMDNPAYAQHSRCMAAAIRRAGGVEHAASIIETVAREEVRECR